MYRSDLQCLQRIVKEEGVRQGLYKGWSLQLARCLPMTLLQYIVFQNLRFITRKK